MNKKTTLDCAMMEVRLLLAYGWEYPDAAVKIAVKYGIDVDWIHLTYVREDIS